jgi:hypothetical protein
MSRPPGGLGSGRRAASRAAAEFKFAPAGKAYAGGGAGLDHDLSRRHDTLARSGVTIRDQYPEDRL